VKLVTKYSLIFLSLVIFSTTTGFNVFAHFCKKDGVSISYVVPTNHACADKQEILPSCCHKEKNQAPKMDDNCCSEEVWSYKLNTELDYTISISTIVLIPFQFHSFNYLFPSYCFESTGTAIYEYLPPPKTGKSILIAHQVFRI
jgi:hypothetical protein